MPEEGANERMLSAILEKNREANGAGAPGAASDEYGAKPAGRSIGRKRALRFAAAALCLFVAAGWMFHMNGGKGAKSVIQQWDPSFTAADYFKYSTADSSGSSAKSVADASMHCDAVRSFSGLRTEFEKKGVIPVIDTHPLFEADACYLEGSLYSITLSWHRRDLKGVEHYSDLKLTAGFEEIPAIEDVVYIETDGKGRVIEPAVTVTERDGVAIISRGSSNTQKTMTFENETGWYQVSGSWNDSFEDVAGLFEWFWEHGLDFSLFPPEEGDEYTYTGADEAPKVFEGLLPDFGAFGYTMTEGGAVLKNGMPVSYEASFTLGSAEGGEPQEEIHWRLNVEPDFYDYEGCIGEIGSLTKEQVMGLEPPDRVTAQTRIQFMQGNLVVTTVYAKDLEKAWELIESLK